MSHSKAAITFVIDATKNCLKDNLIQRVNMHDGSARSGSRSKRINKSLEDSHSQHDRTSTLSFLQKFIATCSTKLTEFLPSTNFKGISASFDADIDYAKSILSASSCTVVFPEALLERPNVHVKVLFPSSDLFRSLFTQVKIFMPKVCV